MDSGQKHAGMTPEVMVTLFSGAVSRSGPMDGVVPAVVSRCSLGPDAQLSSFELAGTGEDVGCSRGEGVEADPVRASESDRSRWSQSGWLIGPKLLTWAAAKDGATE